jgi:diguanylate cyclase (GGDEF)-like protein
LLRLALVLALVLLPSLHLFAQHYTFRHYGQDEGLRNLDVFGMVEDSDGALWMATENGLFRYDGSRFLRYGAEYGLGEQLVLNITKDVFGRIWVSTNSRFYQLISARLVPVPLGQSESHMGVGQTVAVIDRDHLLLLLRGSLVLLTAEGDGWRSSPFLNQDELARNPALQDIHSVLVAGGSLWLGCAQSICRISHPLDSTHRGLEIFSTDKGVPAEDRWSRLFEDAQGDLWVRGANHIIVLPKGEDAFRLRDIPEGLTPYRGSGLITLAQDRQGFVLTQTNHGIARWEKNAWRLFDASNGIVAKDVSTILVDRTGHIWFATRGHGIYRWLGYGEVENWTSSQGLKDDVAWPVYRDSRDRLWLSDQFQVGLMDEATHRIASPAVFAGSPFAHATGYAESTDGSLWFFRINGEVVRTDPEARRMTFRAQLPSLSRNLTDSQGRIWIMSRNGLFVIRRPSGTGIPVIEQIDQPQIAADAFADAAETPDHDLWFLADQHLYRLSHIDGSFSAIALDPIATRGQMRGIAAAPDGTLWIGGGIPALLHMRVKGDTAQILHSISMPTIASYVVQTVRFDTRGRLWIGTDLGVNVFDGKSWSLITQRDGIISNDTDEGAFFAEKDGSVWIGVNGGAVHILHPESFFAAETLDVSMTSASFAGHPLPLSKKPTATAWEEGSFDTTFTSHFLARDSSLRFRYRLIGLESYWSETTAHDLHYPAIPPGSYRLELQAVDPDRQWQSPVTSFSFTISPPWWRTWPFYLALFLVSLLASGLLWNWRESRLLRRQRQLRHLVAQRTRELEAEKVELLATREALRLQATKDALTGLWNRSAILEILSREMERAHRSGTTLAVVLADVDHFKQINDTMGHLAGDAVLREASARMVENIRPYDFIGRYGGEEFLFVLPGLPFQDPHARLTQLQQCFNSKVFSFEGRTVGVTSSFGVAWLDPTMVAIEDLVRCADEALYQAKDRGRDRIVFYGTTLVDGTSQLTT